MTPDTIIIHCSATKENSNFTVEQVEASHKERGFKRPNQTERLKHIGYQYYIRKDGTVHKGRREDEVGAHCTNWNSRSIGICYEGGLDASGKAKDTRTPAQKAAITNLINEIARRWIIIQIIGHRDTSPDKNGNGVIDPHERIKECPCYDVIPEHPNYLPQIVIKL